MGGSAVSRGEDLSDLLPACLLEWSEKLLNCFLPQGEGEHLPDCLSGELSHLLPPREGEGLPGKFWHCLLPQGEGEHLPGK